MQTPLGNPSKLICAIPAQAGMPTWSEVSLWVSPHSGMDLPSSLLNIDETGGILEIVYHNLSDRRCLWIKITMMVSYSGYLYSFCLSRFVHEGSENKTKIAANAPGHLLLRKRNSPCSLLFARFSKLPLPAYAPHPHPCRRRSYRCPHVRRCPS